MLRRTDQVWEKAITDWTNSLKVGRSQLTIRQRRWQIRKLAEAHIDRSPWKLSTDDLTEWLIDRGWGDEARKSAQAALRGFYGWAVRNGRTRRDPTGGLESVTIPHRLPRPARDDVLNRALAAADDRLRLMLMLAAHGGLRVSEIARLRWDDIDGDWMTVSAKRRERRVPIAPALADELAGEYARRRQGRLGSGFRYGHGDPDIYVFPGRRRGTGMNPTWVSQLISAALGSGVTAHQLRHRAAMRALHGTRDLAAVQELLGHVDPATTKIYARASDDALRAAVEAI